MNKEGKTTGTDNAGDVKDFCTSNDEDDKTDKTGKLIESVPDDHDRVDDRDDSGTTMAAGGEIIEGLIQKKFVQPIPPVHLNTSQIRTVDDSFERLFGYKWGTKFEWNKKNITDEDDDGNHNYDVAQLLCEIVGSKAAGRILYHCTNTTATMKRKRNDVHTHYYMNNNPNTNGENSFWKKHRPSDSTMDGPDSSKQISTTINEKIRKEDSTVSQPTYNKQQVPRPSQSTSSSNTIRHGNVDTLLQQIANDGMKLSTVAKTSADWDQFKIRTGLGDKLEEHIESNTAFLKRQEFLTRVDQRQFTIEKAQRNVERAKRGI